MVKHKNDELNEKMKLYKSIAAIAQTLLYLKEALEKNIEIAIKQDTNLTLTNQKLDFYKDDIDEVKTCIRMIEKTMSSLNIQLDFKEKEANQKKRELQKELDDNKQVPLWDKIANSFSLFMKNSKWIAIILIVLIVFLCIKAGVISIAEVIAWVKSNFHVNIGG